MSEINSTIVIIIFIIIFIYAWIHEHSDRNKIPDIPTCAFITNYCNEYGKKQNIKYVIKESINNETPMMLLSMIKNEYTKFSQIVYWRIALFNSVGICILFWAYNIFTNVDLNIGSYLYLFIASWFLIYFMRNYFDFHYISHIQNKVNNAVDKLTNEISKNYSEN